MQLYIGTSGYSYREWKGAFYPHDLAAKDMLRFYGGNLPAVEINNTFHAMPRASVLETWAAQVPPGFRFVLKAPRKITHTMPLREKSEEVDYLFTTAAVLGEKLGAVLFQLPPQLRRNRELLAAFVDLLPAGARVAFEFRHPSWFEEEIYDILRQKGCALCCADSDNEEISRFVATTDWGYLRLRKPDYPEAELLAWARKIRSQKWHTIFGFFKHEDGGAGPRMAKHLLDLCRAS